MTTEQVEQFRADFKEVISLKGRVKDVSDYHNQLVRWDKDGSHKAKILEAIEEVKKVKQEYNNKLNGKTYEQWQEFGKKVTVLMSRLKNALDRKYPNAKTVDNIKNLIGELTF